MNTVIFERMNKFSLKKKRQLLESTQHNITPLTVINTEYEQ